jgi:hypothetical protein
MSITTPAPFTSTRSRAAIALALGAALVLAAPGDARAQTSTACGLEAKEEVAKALASVELASDAQKQEVEKKLYAQYQPCSQQDAAQIPSSFKSAARQCGATVSNLGSLFYEEMPCAGYDPQRRQFAAPVKIKQPFGFGGAPLPGSREYVLHCVADAAGVLRPVGRDSVHLANSNDAPTWQFAVIVNAGENLQVISPMNGATRRARSILSWGFNPTGCEFVPIWGNALNYRIRLDQ